MNAHKQPNNQTTKGTKEQRNKMNINDLTIGEAKELSNLFNSGNSNSSGIDSHLIDKVCIFRTYSAGVFFGKLKTKIGKECIVDNCRRLWYWKTKDGISLSEVSKTGLHSDSKVCAETNNHWLEAIEIIPCSQNAISNIVEQADYVS